MNELNVPLPMKKPAVSQITCPMCGFSYDPQGHTGCASCPLNQGCQLVCCPNCGFETVDPEKSILARFARKLLLRKEQH